MAKAPPWVEGAEDEDSLVSHVHSDNQFVALRGHDSSDDGGRCASRLVPEEDAALVAQEHTDFLKSSAASDPPSRVWA